MRNGNGIHQDWYTNIKTTNLQVMCKDEKYLYCEFYAIFETTSMNKINLWRKIMPIVINRFQKYYIVL